MQDLTFFQDTQDGQMRSLRADAPRKGRGAVSNRESRFDRYQHQAVDDGWWQDEPVSGVATQTLVDDSRTIISTNNSPDIPFNQSINPYKGCEHGCIYCYARPSHAYWDLSPGLDFETRILIKPNAAELLRKTFAKSSYRCQVVTVGANTDPYQPLERELRTTRQILEVLQEHQHPFSIITKSALILRDIDILADMAADNLCSVAVSITTLDDNLKRVMEPRTGSGGARLRSVERMAGTGIPVTVMAAPMIPMINDHELEAILDAANSAGASAIGYIFLRLPLEVRQLFVEWLETHFPLRSKHVMSIIRQSRDGLDYQPRFGERMRGTGVFADLLNSRFKIACKRLGYPPDRRFELDISRFRAPHPQLSLFD